MVSDTALQSLTLSLAIFLSKRGIKSKVAAGSTRDLNKVDPKQSLSFLLTITKVLPYKNKTYKQVEKMKAHKIEYNVPVDPHGYAHNIVHSATQGISKPSTPTTWELSNPTTYQMWNTPRPLTSKRKAMTFTFKKGVDTRSILP